MAIFYVNYETGSDTATTIKSGTASNPSGTITRITSTGHGYSNGDKILLYDFSTWLNEIWTVTNAQTNTFDLQGAVWQTTGDTGGLMVKIVNGDTWGTAAKSVNRIMTNYNAGLKATDEIRIAKTAEPTSIGNATWTSRSITVTLATAQTTLIDDADSGWVAAAGGDVTVTTNTTRKSGTARTVFTFDAAPQTNIKQAYKTLAAPLNLSGYDSITFWFQNSATLADDNRLKISLCSDTTGDTVVDDFYIPQINTAASNNYITLDLTRNGGGALGNNINSIAIYSRGAAVTASSNYSIDNINACNANGLTLNTLIGKSSTAWTTDLDKQWYPIKSISGTTITLDQDTTNTTMTFGNQLRGYYTLGTSPETVTTYILKPWQPPMNRTNAEDGTAGYVDWHNWTTRGTASQQFIISGGWNTSNNTQDGITFANGRGNGNGFIWCAKDYNTWSRMGGMRFQNATYNFYQNTGSANDRRISEIVGIANSRGAFMIGFNVPTQTYRIENIYAIANSSSCYIRSIDYNAANIIKNWFFISNQDQVEFQSGGSITVSVENFKLYNNGMVAGSSNLSRAFRTQNTALYDLVWKDIDYRHNVGPLFQISTNAGEGPTGYYPTKFVNFTALNTSNNVFYVAGTSTGSPANQIPTSITFINANIQGNNSPAVALPCEVYYYNSNNTETPKVNSTTQKYIAAYYDRFNGVENDNRIYWFTANAIQQNTTTYSGTGYAWQLSITGSTWSSIAKLRFKISTVAFNANSQVTYKVWVKKTHATAIAGEIYIEGGTFYDGTTTDKTVSIADNTNWQEMTLTFTPTSKGVVNIYLRSWVTASPYTNSIYVDSVTVTQA